MNFPILNNNKIIIVALSGGKDSSCLLHMVMNNYKNNTIIAVIINHNLRENSYEEALEIKKYWQSIYNINIYIINWNNPISKQVKAREFRLLNLSIFAIKNNSNIVFLGHNYEDKIETYLMRLGKSTSWGLGSISPKTTIYGVKFYRPLLYTPINYIINYIKENNIKIFEDYTNKTNKYTRNLLRNKIIKSLNINTISNSLIIYVEERKKYEHLINLWINIHLIIINRFAYKFLWNRLPKCFKLSSLILMYIGEKIRCRRIDSHEKFFPYLNKKVNFHVNNCKFTHRGDYTYITEIYPENIHEIVLRHEGVWWYKFMIINIGNKKNSFIFYLKKLPIFIFNNKEIDLSEKNFLLEDEFFIKYIGYNFQSEFNS